METTWDMSPAKRKMFIVAASFPSFVRARGTLLVAGFSCFRERTRRVLFVRKRGAGVDAVKMKDSPQQPPPFPRFTQSGYGRGAFACFLVSYQPLARRGFGRPGRTNRPSAGVSGVRHGASARHDVVGSRASNGLGTAGCLKFKAAQISACRARSSRGELAAHGRCLCPSRCPAPSVMPAAARGPRGAPVGTESSHRPIVPSA